MNLLTHNRQQALVVSIGILAVLVASEQVADARPLERGTFAYGGDSVVDWCGSDAPFRDQFDVTGTVVGRVTGQRGGDGFRYSQTYHGTAIWTNLATERSISIVWNDHDQDLHITDNGDGTGTLLWQSSGTVNYYGPDGKFVTNGPGAARLETIIDFAGTPGDPSDDTVISGKVVSNVGRFPPTECELYRDLTVDKA